MKMALMVYTSQPQKLLTDIKKQIDEKKIETWEYDKDGDFTHSVDQWKNKGYLRPHITSGCLQFGLLGLKSTSMSRTIYGVYHGRFIEMLLTHFYDQFSNATATSQPQAGLDQVQLQ